jgi:hypothetical protein
VVLLGLGVLGEDGCRGGVLLPDLLGQFRGVAVGEVGVDAWEARVLKEVLLPDRVRVRGRLHPSMPCGSCGRFGRSAGRRYPWQQMHGKRSRWNHRDLPSVRGCHRR